MRHPLEREPLRASQPADARHPTPPSRHRHNPRCWGTAARPQPVAPLRHVVALAAQRGGQHLRAHRLEHNLRSATEDSMTLRYAYAHCNTAFDAISSQTATNRVTTQHFTSQDFIAHHHHIILRDATSRLNTSQLNRSQDAMSHKKPNITCN